MTDDEGGAPTKVFVEHTVSFILGDDERFVVSRRGVSRGYALAYGITVNFLSRGQIRVHASGTVCNKDGTFGLRRGRICESITLPDEAAWIERAKRQIDGFDAGENDPCIICGHPQPEHYAWSTECTPEGEG